MIAFDRDGVLTGVLGDWEACHPKHYNNSVEMPLIKEVIQKINKPCVVISNQQGIKWGYCSLETVIGQFEWLMQRVPQIQASLFCPDGGNKSWIVKKDGWIRQYETEVLINFFRKPEKGMAVLARDLGFDIDTYVGDLSGNPDYADGRDSDRLFAQNAGLKYLDVNKFILK